MRREARAKGFTGCLVWWTCVLLLSLACPSHGENVPECERLGCECYSGDVDCSDRGLESFPDLSAISRSFNITKL